MYSQIQHLKQIWIRMYINLILFCVKFNYTDLQMSQNLSQIQIKNCFLVVLIATFIDIFLPVRNMLPEWQEVLHNRLIQISV